MKRVVIDTGGSGGAIYAYIFSSINGQIRQIFDSGSVKEYVDFSKNQSLVLSKLFKIIYYSLRQVFHGCKL
ncbi:hypothetical protein V7161_18000 [Neobacillus drentensis]